MKRWLREQDVASSLSGCAGDKKQPQMGLAHIHFECPPMKRRVRLSEEDIARRWPPKHRVILPPDFDLEARIQRREERLAKFRLPNIPTKDECKYIYGELHDPDAHYCGAGVLPGKSWCERHHKLCTRILATPERVYRGRRRR